MSYDAQYLQLEQALLLSPNGTVLVDIYRNRTGAHYDPFGLVARAVREADKGQVCG